MKDFTSLQRQDTCHHLFETASGSDMGTNRRYAATEVVVVETVTEPVRSRGGTSHALHGMYKNPRSRVQDPRRGLGTKTLQLVVKGSEEFGSPQYSVFLPCT